VQKEELIRPRALGRRRFVVEDSNLKISDQRVSVPSPAARRTGQKRPIATSPTSFRGNAGYNFVAPVRS